MRSRMKGQEQGCTQTAMRGDKIRGRESLWGTAYCMAIVLRILSHAIVVDKEVKIGQTGIHLLYGL